MILRIVCTVEPLRLKSIHFQQKILHFVVLKPLHADKARHHLDQHLFILCPDQLSRDNEAEHLYNQIGDLVVLAELGVQLIEK